jgi:hypothetical protein
MENIDYKNYSIKYESDEYIKIIPKKKNILENDKQIDYDENNKYLNMNENLKKKINLENDKQMDYDENNKYLNMNKNLETNKNLDSNIILNEIFQKNKNKIKNEDDNFYEDYNELKKVFNNFFENVLNGIKEIKNIIKKMDKQTYKNDINKKKQIKKTSVKKEKGFGEEKLVPEPIQIFFNLEKNEKMSRIKVGGLFQEYLRKNNLKGNINEKNKIDKRIYKIDDKLSKLFGISKEDVEKINSCSSSTIKYPNGYNFSNYQTWIKKIYNENECKNTSNGE